MAKPIPLPVQDRLVTENGRITDPWNQYIAQLGLEQSRASTSTGSVVNLTAQGATISSTALPISTVYTALYRISYSARITRAATTNSSLTVTIGWTEGGESLSQSGAAITGNTTTTQQNGTLAFLVDGNSPITYSTTYSSTGATSMQYRLYINAELVT